MRPLWHIVVMDPLRLLVWVNAVAATGCFGLALLWLLSGSWYGYLMWMLAVLAAGAFLSLTAFAGERLLR